MNTSRIFSKDHIALVVSHIFSLAYLKIGPKFLITLLENAQNIVHILTDPLLLENTLSKYT